MHYHLTKRFCAGKTEKTAYRMGVFLGAGSIFSVVWIVLFCHTLFFHPYVRYLDSSYIESDVFRAMQFGSSGLEQLRLFADRHQLPLEEVVTVCMIENGYELSESQGETLTLPEYVQKRDYFRRISAADFLKLEHAYRAVLGDLQVFPIPSSTNPDVAFVGYENSWKDARTYGGERFHEGCDLMGMEYERGFYPVCSITGGVVEQKGWLEQGGWRIGIRSESGAYFYYAHLSAYADKTEPGDPILPGQLLGWMGDSGYSPREGTVGNFPVHLHLGIYLVTDHFDEMSVNPYYILKYLEKTGLRQAVYGFGVSEKQKYRCILEQSVV